MEAELEQEIEWLKEEISEDESVLDSSDGSQFHKDRLAENKAKLAELEERDEGKTPQYTGT